MQPAGHAEIDRAKADGRWAKAYGGSKTMEFPPDLLAAIEAEPKALDMFQNDSTPAESAMRSASAPTT